MMIDKKNIILSDYYNWIYRINLETKEKDEFDEFKIQNQPPNSSQKELIFYQLNSDDGPLIKYRVKMPSFCVIESEKLQSVWKPQESQKLL